MPVCTRDSLPIIVVSLIAAGLLIASALILRATELATPWRVAVALAPLPAYVALFALVVRNTRRLDELKRRMQFEATAVALVGTLLATTCHGMLLKADVGFPELDWGGVWIIATLFYALGSLIAWRRYR